MRILFTPENKDEFHSASMAVLNLWEFKQKIATRTKTLQNICRPSPRCVYTKITVTCKSANKKKTQKIS